jgi:glycosyltransferase involved in cell wall biosynthesis
MLLASHCAVPTTRDILALMSEQPAGREPEPPAPDPPHVLLIVDRDGFERFGPMFRQLGFALSNEGMRVSLLTDDLPAAQTLDGTPVIDYFTPHLSGWQAWRLGPRLDELFPDPPDLVHLWGAPALGRISRWTRRNNIPLVIHLTGLDDVRTLRHHRTRPHERVVALAPSLADAWSSRLAATDDDLECRLAPVGLLPPREAGPLLTPERTLGLLCAGALAQPAGLISLLEAVAQLRAASAELHLVLTGPDEEVHEAWRLIRARSLQDSVTLTQGRALWAQAAHGCDVFIAPAVRPQLDLPALWAMAAGRLVLAARGQHADWFIDDETCWLFDPASPAELVALLRRAVERLPAAHGLARSAAAYVARRHGITALASRLVETYRAARGLPATPVTGPRLHA